MFSSIFQFFITAVMAFILVRWKQSIWYCKYKFRLQGKWRSSKKPVYLLLIKITLVFLNVFFMTTYHKHVDMWSIKPDTNVAQVHYMLPSGHRSRVVHGRHGQCQQPQQWDVWKISRIGAIFYHFNILTSSKGWK